MKRKNSTRKNRATKRQCMKLSFDAPDIASYTPNIKVYKKKTYIDPSL